jgi:Na+/alanine symporter
MQSLPSGPRNFSQRGKGKVLPGMVIFVLSSLVINLSRSFDEIPRLFAEIKTIAFLLKDILSATEGHFRESPSCT